MKPVKIDGQFYDIPPAVRCWQKYDSQTRADRAASFRLGFRQRECYGEFYWIHPLVSDRAFPTRADAYRAALASLGLRAVGE